MRIVMINIYDVMNEHFSHAALKSTIALDAVTGTNMGPRSPNTVYSYLHRATGEHLGQTGTTQVLGGMGAFGQSLATAAEKLWRQNPTGFVSHRYRENGRPRLWRDTRLGGADLRETGDLQR